MENGDFEHFSSLILVRSSEGPVLALTLTALSPRVAEVR